ncbi:MAG: dienelactone hydrolase family protein, partial [Gammaproteobacteria bacterium]
HGSGSSRDSPRNRYVASVLNQAGIATVLMDLLTQDEEIIDNKTRHLRFDIPLLAERLIGVTDWIHGQKILPEFKLGYFGASTGAAAALVAAAQRPSLIAAIVSRGGRPDLAGSALSDVKAPTLLLVGGNDPHVILLNQEAIAQLHLSKATLHIIPHATHLFEEPGALESVAQAATKWFAHYFQA